MKFSENDDQLGDICSTYKGEMAIGYTVVTESKVEKKKKTRGKKRGFCKLKS